MNFEVSVFGRGDMMLEKIFNGIFSFVESVCKVMICIQIISVTIVVIGRYVFNITPAWGEELTLFCLVWMCLTGAALPLRNNGHLQMTLIDRFCSPKELNIIEIVGDILIAVFSIVVFISGVVTTRQVSRTLLYGIRISKGFLYLAVPVSMLLFLLALTEKYYKRFKELKKKGEA